MGKRHLNGTHRLLLSTTLTSALLAGSAPALSADAPAETTGSPQAAGDVRGLEEIVVTAQKRKENLQNVPISITAITSAALETAHADGLSSLEGTIPNVQLSTFVNAGEVSVFVIRGVGVSDADPYVGTAVSIVVDGVVQGTNTTAGQDLFDIDRIEVLRGPQGTLFGANTTGGVVNILTKQPTGVYGGEIKGELGNYSSANVDASVDFPIVQDVLAGKVVLEHKSRDGFFTNTVDGERIGGVDRTSNRDYLKYTPNGLDLDSTLIVEYDRIRDGSPIAVNDAPPGYILYRAPGYQGINFEVGSTVPDVDNQDIYGATWTTNWASPIGRLAAITGFRTYDLINYTDQDGIPAGDFLAATYRTTQASQFSEEVRDEFKPVSTIDVTSGVYFSNNSYKARQTFIQQGFLPGLTNFGTQHEDDLSASAFTQAYWDVLPDLQIQGGIRATYDKAHMVDTNYNFLRADGVATFSANGAVPLGGFLVGANHSWGLLGGKFGIDYHVTDDVSTYFTASRGFKSGGFSGRIAVPTDIGPYNPEYVNAYEVGVKSDWFEHRLRINADAFLNDYQNQQLTTFYYVGKNESSTILNAGQSQTQGVELELHGRPINGLTINASGAYLYARYVKFTENNLAGQPVSVAGYPLQYSPRWNASISADYSFGLLSGTASLDGQYSFTSPQFTSITDYPLEHIGSINVFNGTVQWGPDDARWTIGAYCTNCANRKYLTSGLQVPGVLAFAAFGDPAQYGVRFKYDFGG